jgi:CRISPR-associated endonuclease Csn1
LKANPLTDVDKNVIQKIKIWGLNEYIKNRVPLDSSFDEKKISKIAEYKTTKENTGLRNLLLSHLNQYDNDPKKAFEGEGLENLGKKNGGRMISKISVYEPIGNKFEIRPGQYVEAAKGTNLFFLVHENTETKEREFQTLGLKDVIDLKSHGLPLAEYKEGYRWFTLSPNDLVYVPESEEDLTNFKLNNLQPYKIFKFVSCTGKRAYFIPHTVSKTIIDGKEFSALNKLENTDSGISIKNVCIKLSIDRLGKIKIPQVPIIK